GRALRPGVRRPWWDARGGWCAITGQTLFRRGVLGALGGFTPGAEPAEDQDLWLRVGRNPVTFTRQRVLGIRIHSGQDSRLHSELTELQTGIRENFVKTLPPAEEARGRRAIRFWLARLRAQ